MPHSQHVAQARLDLAQILWDDEKYEEAQDLMRQNLSSESGEVIIQTKIMLMELLASQKKYDDPPDS